MVSWVDYEVQFRFFLLVSWWDLMRRMLGLQARL